MLPVIKVDCRHAHQHQTSFSYIAQYGFVHAAHFLAVAIWRQAEHGYSLFQPLHANSGLTHGQCFSSACLMQEICCIRTLSLDGIYNRVAKPQFEMCCRAKLTSKLI